MSYPEAAIFLAVFVGLNLVGIYFLKRRGR